MGAGRLRKRDRFYDQTIGQHSIQSQFRLGWKLLHRWHVEAGVARCLATAAMHLHAPLQLNTSPATITAYSGRGVHSSWESGAV